MISARFSSEEAGMVRQAAEASGLSLSEFVRRATLQAIAEPASTCTVTILGSTTIATAGPFDALGSTTTTGDMRSATFVGVR